MPMIAPLIFIAATCSDLAMLRLGSTTVVDARIVAGTFRPPASQPSSPEFFSAYNKLPQFRRVQATSTPARGSHINIEVWLPSKWNGRLLGVGNGGFGGSIPYFRLGEAVNSGYAVAATDTGHEGGPRDAQ